VADADRGDPAEEHDYRLPRTVIPRRYDLRIEPDLPSASFAGAETVAVDVVEAVREVVLNAADLQIDEAWLERDGPARPCGGAGSARARGRR
jgi:hypothetical protein